MAVAFAPASCTGQWAYGASSFWTHSTIAARSNTRRARHGARLCADSLESGTQV